MENRIVRKIYRKMNNVEGQATKKIIRREGITRAIVKRNNKKMGD